MPSGFTTRPPFEQAPADLRAAIEAAVGSRIAGTESIQDGMSPGPAALLTLRDGRQVFAKAVAASIDSTSHLLYARELATLRVLPPTVPHAPLVAGVEHRDWIVVVTEAADGPALGPPWRSQDVAIVADAIATSAALTDVPTLGPAIDRLPDLDGWHTLAHEHPDQLDDWERARINGLVAISDGWRTWTAGRHLVHLDIRCDNAVPRGDEVWLVDWASACHGAAWIDTASLAVDVVASGHVGGQHVAVSLSQGLLSQLPYEATRFVVAVAGMLRRESLSPAWSALPGFRDWQRHRALSLRPLVERLVSR
ncbi:hypothetical protein ACFQU3_00995 [Terrabacter sp. GCM10028922]|uniref:hypothetical protein n=1 Tax=Terrabacter sp. GCM10028922 TaxID=3273428 RepID=UPI00360B6DB3